MAVPVFFYNPTFRTKSRRIWMERRKFLRDSAGIGVVGSVSVGAIPGVTATEPDGSITFEEQTTDGSSIVVAEISTGIDAMMAVRNQDADETLVRPHTNGIEAGTYEEYEIELDSPLADSAELAVSLHDDDGQGFARDTAIVYPGEDIELVDGIEPTLIDADPAAGFEYPYYLFAPSRLGSEEPQPLLVEPTNTGTATDDFERHLEAAGRSITSSSTRDIAEELGAPLLVPVFPRPSDEPVDWRHYVHALDDNTMGIDGGPLERVDLQLLNMVNHAQEYLADDGYAVSTDGILLNGFSASGNFVDRFAVLHPEEVISVTAGGLNGMALLPLEEYDGRELPFHVGIADVEQLTGEPLDREALSETNQFLYMGAEDGNDTIPYDDAWTSDELRELALDVYGSDMITERFPTCQQAYREAGIEAQFRVYSDAGHTPRPAREDVLEFHRRSIDGRDVSEFGDDISPGASIDVSSTTASTGEGIEFDASDSRVVGDAEVVTYLWDFDDGSEATGETTTNAYDEEGKFTVELMVVTDRGEEYRTTTDIEVVADEDDDSFDDSGDDQPTTEEDTDDGDTDSQPPTDDPEDQPGFGIGSALVGIGGAAYSLKCRLTDTESESES